MAGLCLLQVLPAFIAPRHVLHCCFISAWSTFL